MGEEIPSAAFERRERISETWEAPGGARRARGGSGQAHRPLWPPGVAEDPW